MAAVTEEHNTKWLSLIKSWVEQEKTNPISLLFGNEESSSILQAYKAHKENLHSYLKSLDVWLKHNGIEEALKQMPTIGKLLSQLCKLPVFLVDDKSSMELTSCIVDLSELFNPVKDANNQSNAHRRAKTWAVGHFSTMNSTYVEGIDMFLMEEFGISQKEYMLEHSKQIAQQVAENFENFLHLAGSNDDMLLSMCSNVCEMMEIMDNDCVLPIIKSILTIVWLHLKISENSKWISISCMLSTILSENKILFQKLTVDSLDYLFCLDYSIFEDYIITLIEQCTSFYPAVDNHLVRSCINETKLIELCLHSEKYYIGTVHIMKDSLNTVGVDLAIICLLRTFEEIYKDRQGGFFVTNEKYKKGITSNTSGITSTMESMIESIEQVCDENKNTKAEGFEVWFDLIHHKTILDDVILLLFDGERQFIHSYIKIILYYFYPTKMKDLATLSQTMTSYVFAIRNLQQKKHVELSDITYLASSVKKKLHHVVDSSIVILIINIMFFIKFYGGALMIKPFFTALSMDDLSADDFTQYTLYTVHLVLQSKWNISELNSQTFKDIIEGIKQRYIKLESTRQQVSKPSVNASVADRCERLLNLF